MQEPAPVSTVIISSTGRQHGAGTDRYKWVSGLTARERAAVRDGSALVIVTGSPVCREAPGALQTVRRVLYRRQCGGRYIPRMVRDDQERAAVLAALRASGYTA